MAGRTRWMVGGLALLALAGGATGVAVAADGDTDGDDVEVQGADRERAAEAALVEAGGGTVVDVEGDVAGYEVEVVLDDGTEVEVRLDAAFGVVGTETQSGGDELDD